MSHGVPLVDLEQYKFGGDNRREFVQSFGDALIEFGFVRVRGHGIDRITLMDCYQQAKQFFALEPEVKMAYHVPGDKGVRGYTPFGEEVSADTPDRPDLKEYMHIGREEIRSNLWPKEVSDFRRHFLHLYTQLDVVSIVLLQALAERFGLDSDHFASKVKGADATLRILHYPPLSEALAKLPHSVRSAEHEDINMITLMPAPTDGGLEIQTRDGRWIMVDASPGELIVDSGDMLAYMTMNEVPATRHRVTNPPGDAARKSRYSLPYFANARNDAKLSIHDVFVETAGELFARRLARNYPKQAVVEPAPVS